MQILTSIACIGGEGQNSVKGNPLANEGQKSAKHEIVNAQALPKVNNSDTGTENSKHCKYY